VWPIPVDTVRKKNDASQNWRCIIDRLGDAMWWCLMFHSSDSYLSKSLSLVGVGGNCSTCGLPQPTWFLQYFLNQFLNATTIASEDVGT
jgi:hypothetical protein